jgi:hypothetical protein
VGAGRGSWGWGVRVRRQRKRPPLLRAQRAPPCGAAQGRPAACLLAPGWHLGQRRWLAGSPQGGGWATASARSRALARTCFLDCAAAALASPPPTAPLILLAMDGGMSCEGTVPLMCEKARLSCCAAGIVCGRLHGSSALLAMLCAACSRAAAAPAQGRVGGEFGGRAAERVWKASA